MPVHTNNRVSVDTLITIDCYDLPTKATTALWSMLDSRKARTLRLDYDLEGKHLRVRYREISFRCEAHETSAFLGAIQSYLETQET